MVNDTYAGRLRSWIERTKFFTNPFALSEADQERKHLSGLWVDRPYLYDILGDPDRLQPAFLLARRGEGKTATREMVAYECEKLGLKEKVLAVRYYDFSYLLEVVKNDLSKITAKHHVQAITRACLKTLIDYVPAPYFEQIEENDRNLLATYAEQFADPISSINLKKVLNCTPFDIQLNDLSALETIQMLAKIVRQIRSSDEDQPQKKYEVVYILVDRIDESEMGFNAAVEILKPLVSQRTLLEASGIAFKFFLPISVGEKLLQSIELRKDRISIRQIEWDPDALRQMIERRIQYYSDDRKTSFEELCASSIRYRVMRKLVEASENSPRKLIQLCDRMVYHHVKRSGETLLDNNDLLDAIGEVLHQKEVEDIKSTLYEETTFSLQSKSIREKGLYLDDSGHVWIDGYLLDPPLTDLEFQLLKILYRKAPNIVSTQSLIEMIWPMGGDDQNLRKLIGRIRNRIEPERVSAQSRFIKNSKGRGYWVNKDS